MPEKDIIREAVTRELDKLLRIKNDYGLDSDETKMQLARWAVLDKLWTTLYDDDY